jgi:hypothetical protein
MLIGNRTDQRHAHLTFKMFKLLLALSLRVSLESISARTGPPRNRLSGHFRLMDRP